MRHDLLQISLHLSEPAYQSQLEEWMQGMGVEFSDWFTKDPSGAYIANAHAMKVLHNSEGNLLLTCKTCNQGMKNDATFEAFAQANPWIGEEFLEKNPPLLGTNHLSTQSHTATGEAITAFQQSEFSGLDKDLFNVQKRCVCQKGQAYHPNVMSIARKHPNAQPPVWLAHAILPRRRQQWTSVCGTDPRDARAHSHTDRLGLGR